MTDCIFCKIVKKEIPANIVYEDDDVLAFLDIVPVNPGHMLLIPKTHYEDLLVTPSELSAKMMAVVPMIAKAIMKATGTEGFNIGINTGKDAGQVVLHTHIHIMPRTKTDGHQLWHGEPYKEGEAAVVAGKIRSLFN